MIKVFHCADLHLGTRFSALPDKKATELRSEQRKLLSRLGSLAREESADLILLVGDIFDRPEGDGDSVQALLNFARQVQIPIIISPGNHDYCCPSSPYLNQQWPSNVHIFTKPVLEKYSIPSLNCAVWGAGYTSMDCPGLLEEFHVTGDELIQIMALHGDPIQSDSPSCPVSRSQIRSSGLDYLAMGHIHRAGGFMAGPTFCAWPGCPMGRGFDETGRKGFIIAEVEPGHVQYRFEFLTDITFADLQITAAGDPSGQILAEAGEHPEAAVCRVTLTGESPEPPLWAIQEELEPQFYHLELTDHREVPHQLELTADSLEGTYFRLLRDSLDTASPEERELLILAAKISRKLLEGREVELP